MGQELGSIGSELRDKMAAQKQECLRELHLVWVSIKHPCICQKLTARGKYGGGKESMELLCLG